MIDLNDLRLFARIVEHKGIIKAGRALNLPKSTISRRLAALEERLKCRLIIRSGEEFALTAAGEQVLEAARPLVEAAQMAEDLLLTSATGMTGRVSISASSLFAAHLAEPPTGQNRLRGRVTHSLFEGRGWRTVLDVGGSSISAMAPARAEVGTLLDIDFPQNAALAFPR